MIAWLSATFAMLLVIGGGLTSSGSIGEGLVTISIGAIGLGVSTAAARFYGLQYFDGGSEDGILSADLVEFTETPRKIFITFKGHTTRAIAVVRCVYHGEPALIIEGYEKE